MRATSNTSRTLKGTGTIQCPLECEVHYPLENAMDLLALYNTVKADKGRTPKPAKDWKKKILDPSVKPDDWDFSDLNDNTITRRAQFNSAFEELELCYVIQPVHCIQCGWQHDEHWGIFLHEVHRTQSGTTKFTRINKALSTYFLLPRRIVHNAPIRTHACDRCFVLQDTAQLELPLDTLSATTIEHLATALDEVATMHEAHMKWKEKKQPEHYDFDNPDMDTEHVRKQAAEVKAVDELEW